MRRRVPSLDSFTPTNSQPSSPQLGGAPPQLGPYNQTVPLQGSSASVQPPERGQGGSGERFRGSSELPLTTEGLMKAHKLGMQLAAKGGLDRLMSSSLGRTVQTSKIISHYTHAPITYIGDGLHPWHLGALEGQEVTPERLAFQNHLVRNAPDDLIPGRGPLSTADGESFNSFKNRTINFLKQAMQQSRAKPEEATGLVTHYRVRKLLESWMREGMPEDGRIDPEEMTLNTKGSQPGSIERLVMDPYNGPQMASVDLNNPARLQGGLYIIRHEDTPWNMTAQGGHQS